MRTKSLLFLTHLTTRLLFCVFIGFYNNYHLQGESTSFVAFGDLVARNDFNFEFPRFIVSPLFPLLCGIFKMTFFNYWDTALVLFQIFLGALSGLYLYHIAVLIFSSQRIAILGSLIFSLFPLTLWYTNTFSQEMLFQSLFIFSFYYLLRSLKTGSGKDVAWSAVLFSLSYLTKSHILLFSLFIPLIFFHHFRWSRKTFQLSAIFASICLLLSIPYGIYTYIHYKTYAISSNGGGYQFYLGNTEAGYKTIVDVPKQNTPEFEKIKNIDVMCRTYNGADRYDSIYQLPQNMKPKFFVAEAFAWIKNNPWRFLKMKVYDAVFFLMPGVSFRHYNTITWLLSFIVSLPVYLLSYAAMISMVRKNFTSTAPAFYLFISMLLFSTIWYVQNRFRTITIEPIYIIYAAFLLDRMIKKYPIANKVAEHITGFYTKA